MGIGAILNVTGYFMLGIPIGWFYAFHKDKGVQGIWYGPTFACIWLLVFYNIVIARIDWRVLINEIDERTRKDLEVKARLDQERKSNSTPRGDDRENDVII